MAKTIGKKGIALIKSFEGCRLTAYKPVPTEKYWTIGWGHYGADVKKGQTITQAKADSMLVNDLKSYVASVNNKNYCPVVDKLNQNQFDALVSFCYNCGAGNLKSLCYGKTIKQISNDILLYNKAGGKVLAGLVRRRKAEQELFNAFCEYTVKTTVEGVKIRKTPATASKTTILGTLKKGKKVVIYTEKTVGKYTYGQLKDKTWICLKNTKRV